MKTKEEILKNTIVPQVGAFTAFKILECGRIAKLHIPASAKRVGCMIAEDSNGERKCRASAAKVLSITSTNGKVKYKTGRSRHDYKFMYRVGKTVKPRQVFNTDPMVQCASGIHFFISREEAVAY